MIHSFILKNYGLNGVVFKQNVMPTHVYIVISGDFEISRKNKFGKKNPLEPNDSVSRSYIGPVFPKKEDSDQIKNLKSIRSKPI